MVQSTRRCRGRGVVSRMMEAKEKEAQKEEKGEKEVEAKKPQRVRQRGDRAQEKKTYVRRRRERGEARKKEVQREQKGEKEVEAKATEKEAKKQTGERPQLRLSPRGSRKKKVDDEGRKMRAGGERRAREKEVLKEEKGADQPQLRSKYRPEDDALLAEAVFFIRMKRSSLLTAAHRLALDANR